VEEAAEDVIRRELFKGEQILLAGRPRQGFVLRATDALLIPFSLLWGGFAIFWEVGVIASGAPWFFAIWGVPFVLVGLYIIFGRFLFDARQRARMLYAVTFERVIIISGLLSRRVKSLSLDTLSDVSLTEGRNGSGTISFGPLPPFHSWYGQSGWPVSGYSAVPSFQLADDVRQVYEIICDAQRKAKRRT
jgi:Bacterial PH domain